MKYKKIDMIDLASKIILVIVALIVIYFLILKIIGRSPTIEQIHTALIVALIVAMFNINYKLGRFEEFSEVTKGSFRNLKEDISEIKRKFKR